ncbi:hypothetical protein QWI17_15825 [Gilvimarinus sp. SDUM040013]|uniref:DUF7933 domain-containing protein n=1 Tax=Gilvimarinus gilvus TaxID=3058038 RepID=A0ABU4RVU8_9GAMM|nr:hypothetical protein [Gilvimarinus sp. SDUM040013]MDO3387310.1 hypothetical protein [Gilvimarinus sp. SDUM040013]MDX6848999.1 hypothetical protein [Gilvimarinus sp. SDUM040013]
MHSTQAAADRSGRFRRFIISVITTFFALAFAGEVAAQPTFSKTFSPDIIGPGSVSTLTFTINNGTASPVTDLAFTDNLPSLGPGQLTIADPTFLSNDCGGTLTAPAGGTTITLSDGFVGGSSSCQVTVDVTGTTPGAYNNNSGDLTSSAGNSGPAPDTLTIADDRPGFTKSFAPSSVQFGARSTLIFTIDNSLNADAMSSLAFTDALPVGLEVSSPANAVNDCNGSVLTAVPGSSTISLANDFADPGTLAPGAMCTITVDVQATGVGTLNNRTEELTSVSGFSSPLGSGMASASVEVVVDELALIKNFIDDPVLPGGTATLEFQITNFDRVETVTDITFTDDLDATLSGLVATGLPANDICGTGSSLTGTNVLTLTGASLSSGASCTFSVTLNVPAGATPGSYANTTSAVTGSTAGGPISGQPASDDLVVDVFPVLTKMFLDDPVGAGDTTRLEFTIENTSTSASATSIAFTDIVVGSLSVDSLPANGFCGAGSFIFVNTVGGIPQLNISGANLAPRASCTFEVILQVPVGAPSESLLSTTSEITATVDSQTRTGPAAADSLAVVGAPRLTKSFLGDPVDSGATVTLEFTLEHSEFAPGSATGIAFTDDLDAVLTGLVATGLPQTDICGAGSSITGTSSLSFTGGSLAAGATCTFSVDLTVPAGAAPGVHPNTTSDVSATVSGVSTSGLPANDNLLISAVELTKEFIGDPVLPGASLPLRFTITNTNPDFDATSITFSDDLDDALSGLVATGLPLDDICGSGSQVVGLSSNSLLFFIGGELAPQASCTFDVTVQVPPGAATGTYVNTTGAGSATLDGGFVPFGNAQDDLIVDNNLLSLVKQFTDDPGTPGGTVTLAFTLTNDSLTDSVADISFSDDLDAVFNGLESESGTQNGICGVGSQLSGTSTLNFTGGALPAGQSCSFSVTLRIPGNATGSATSTTSAVTGAVGGVAATGIAASDTLSINNVDFLKSFSGPSAASNTVTLSFTLENFDATAGISGLSFTDDLNAVIAGLIATNTPQTSICGASSQLGGTSLLTFSGGELGPGQSCTFDVELQVPVSATPGGFNSITSNLTSNGLYVSAAVSDILQIEPPPSFAKVFMPNAIALGGTTTLTFTIDNSASTLAASSLAFTDNLPAGLVVAGAPNASNTCGGTLTAVAGAGTIALSGGGVAAGGQCSIQVDVVGNAEGTFVNTSGALTSSSGTSGAATDIIDVVIGDFVLLKSFRTQPVIPGGLVEMELSVVNGSVFALTDIALTDDLDTVLSGLVAEGLPIADTCGAGSSLTGTSIVALTGGNLPASGSCTVVVPVRVPVDAPTGTYTNTTSAASATRQGIPVAAAADSADLVIEPLVLTKVIDPSTVAPDSTTTATYQITNPDPANAATVLAFSDDLDDLVTGLTATNTPINDVCGSGSQVSGASLLTFSGGTVGAGGSCTFDVELLVPSTATPGNYSSVTSSLTSSAQPVADPASAALEVVAPPTFAKAFVPSDIALGGTTTLTFTIDNSASTLAASSLAFTDNLPAGLEVATAPNASSSCGGTVTAIAGATTIGFSGGSVAASSQCTLQVDVLGIANGTIVSTSGALTSSSGDSGTATASLAIGQAARSPASLPAISFKWLILLTLLLLAVGWRALRATNHKAGYG